ncbi:MAG: hypothetical protein QQN41_11400, partial [Nitrosopumilus sp.]
GIMYVWMKSYVPQERLECPEGASLVLDEYSYNCSSLNTINITLVNNGRFDIAGYFIKAGDSPNQTIATIGLSTVLINLRGKNPPAFSKAVLMGDLNDNALKPTQKVSDLFDLSGIGNITALEIIPVRWQREGNQVRFVSCGEVTKIEELVSCQ